MHHCRFQNAGIVQLAMAAFDLAVFPLFTLFTLFFHLISFLTFTPPLVKAPIKAYKIQVVIVGIGGNSAVLYLSLVHKALKLDAISLMFVHHLAVSDIMVSLLLYLPTLVVLCARRWVLGKFLCFGVAFSFFIPLIYEVFTILSITGKQV